MDVTPGSENKERQEQELLRVKGGLRAYQSLGELVAGWNTQSEWEAAVKVHELERIGRMARQLQVRVEHQQAKVEILDARR